MDLIGERLAEIRNFNGDTQTSLAQKLNVSPYTVSSWEQEKSSPDHETLVKICKLYSISSDYLLGLSNVDPAYVQRKRLELFSKDELREIKSFEDYLIWRRAKK